MFYSIVVWNLVVIAAERYLAVCGPFKHNEFTRYRIVRIWVSFYIMTVILNFSTAFEVRPLSFLWFRSLSALAFFGFILINIINTQFPFGLFYFKSVLTGCTSLHVSHIRPTHLVQTFF